jgi:PAS domain S-box-containing protein
MPRKPTQGRRPSRREAEALEHSARRLRALVAATSDLLWDTPPEGTFVSEQEAWGAFTGQTWEQMRGWGWLEAVHPEEREATVRAWRTALETRTPFRGEHRLRRWDGEYRHMLVRAVPVLAPEGAVLEWVGAHRDITLQRQHEAALERLMAESRAAHRAKDEFLAVMSHELRTPLTAVLGWTQMLRSRMTDVKALERGLGVIERNSRLLTRLIEDMLDMSRILNRKLTLQRRAVDVVGVVQAAVEGVRPRAEEKALEVVLEPGPAVALVGGDPVRLQQVFWNLLMNAVKFTPQGGRVTARVERTEREVRVVVRDTGRGIRAEVLPRLFERFWQEDASATREHGGLGLGLALVHHLVELHGGRVRAESAGEGQGATFTVVLPVPAVLPEPESELPPGAEGAVQGGQLEGVKVLLVEDAVDARELVAMLLRERGAEVSTAAGGAEAMARLGEALPDVLVSDIGLPGEDGHALLQRVRAWTEAKDQWVPAIALTAYASAEDARRAYRAGFQVHLAKPIEVSALVDAVARLAGRTP